MYTIKRPIGKLMGSDRDNSVSGPTVHPARSLEIFNVKLKEGTVYQWSVE
jgi:hypothetical protein